jgi:hypothetical protein
MTSKHRFITLSHYNYVLETHEIIGRQWGHLVLGVLRDQKHFLFLHPESVVA